MPPKFKRKFESNDEKTFELGKNKRVTIKKFKEIPLIDIREFYLDGEVSKPGKKGISLTLDQWNELVNQLEGIKEALDGLDQGKKAKQEQKEEEEEEQQKEEEE